MDTPIQKDGIQIRLCSGLDMIAAFFLHPEPPWPALDLCLLSQSFFFPFSCLSFRFRMYQTTRHCPHLQTVFFDPGLYLFI